MDTKSFGVGTQKRTAKITIEVSFYDGRQEIVAASRTTTVHFNSWEKAHDTFETARRTIVESSPVAKLERSPIYRMPEIFRLLRNLKSARITMLRPSRSNWEKSVTV